MITVETWAQIRQMHFHQGMSQRQIARRLSIHRSTVKRAIEQTDGPPYDRQRSYTSQLDPFKAEIEQLVAKNDGDIMATVIYQKLANREDHPHLPKYRGSYSTILRYVRKVKAKLRPKEAFLQLETSPGKEAQCDWGKVELILDNRPKRVSMFVLKLSYSRIRFARLYFLERQECFFDGHIKAFEFFDGLVERVTYDNLTTAVFRILSGQNRIQQEAFVRFRGQFPFEANFCAPAKGNEKGKVENDIRYIRSHAFGIDREFASLQAANEHLLSWCISDSQRVHSTHKQVIDELFQHEKTTLRPLPKTLPQPCRLSSVVVNKFSFVNFETNRYSVPVCYVGQTVFLKAFAEKVVITEKEKVIATHQRLLTRQSEAIDPYHFLPLLEKKARAVDQAVVVSSFALDPVFYRLRDAQKQRVENPNRQWIQVLRLTEIHPMQTVIEAIELALVHQVYDYSSIKNLLHQLVEPTVVADESSCLSNHPSLEEVAVVPPPLTRYDQLLSSGGETDGR